MDALAEKLSKNPLPSLPPNTNAKSNTKLNSQSAKSVPIQGNSPNKNPNQNSNNATKQNGMGKLKGNLNKTAQKNGNQNKPKTLNQSSQNQGKKGQGSNELQRQNNGKGQAKVRNHGPDHDTNGNPEKTLAGKKKSKGDAVTIPLVSPKKKVETNNDGEEKRKKEENKEEGNEEKNKGKKRQHELAFPEWTPEVEKQYENDEGNDLDVLFAAYGHKAKKLKKEHNA